MMKTTWLTRLLHSGEMDMLHGSLWDKLTLFALPLALTGVMQQLFNTADVVVLGRLVGNEAMAAVGTDVPIIGMVISLFVGLSIGTNVVIARYIGMGDAENANQAAHTGLVLGLCMGLVVGVLGIAYTDWLIEILDVPAEVRPHAAAYLSMFCLGMPFVSLYNFSAAIFRAKGDTYTPLWALVLGSIINLAGNLICAGLFNLGAGGVALATAIAYALSTIFLLWRLRVEKGTLHLYYERLLTPHLRKFRAMIYIGLPAGIQGMVFSLSNLVIQAAINSLGAAAMAASVAAFTIEINIFCLLNAYGLAATTFIGQNYGAGNLPRCRQVTRVALGLDLLCTLFLSALILWWGRELLGLFSSDEAVIETGMLRIIYVVTPQFINVVMEIFSGAMRGYGYSLPPALVTLVSICGIRLVWVYTLFPLYPSYRTLMIVYPVSWLACVILLWWLYVHQQRRLKAGAAAAA